MRLLNLGLCTEDAAGKDFGNVKTSSILVKVPRENIFFFNFRSLLFWDVTNPPLIITDVSGLPIGLTFKGKEVQENWTRLLDRLR